MFNKHVNFYDEDGKLKSYRLLKFIDSGSLGSVYNIGSGECLKWFTEEYYYDIDAIKAIRDLKLENFYQIYDLLFDINGEFMGYTMKYYEKENINILKMPTYYTLDNLYRLYNSFRELAKNHIIADDGHNGNVIMDDKNITVIDTDFYFINDMPSDKNRYIINRNYKVLLGLFRDIYLCAFSNPPIFDDSPESQILKDLFNGKLIDIERKLENYKYPIDYVKARRKEMR